PKTPSAPGVFASWEQANGPGVTVDDQGFVYVDDPNAIFTEGPRARIQKFTPGGEFVSMIASEPENFLQRGLSHPPGGMSLDADGNIYVLDENTLKKFEQDDFSADGSTTRYDHIYGPDAFFEVFHAMRQVAVDPSTGFILSSTDLKSPCPEGPGTS